ncbi:MAG: hypothetical protein P8184_19490 [Calditrichia bacterium]
MAFHFLNCFLLIVPPLLWNFAFTSRLPKQYASDEGISPSLLHLENMLQILVFGFPVLLPLQFGNPLRLTGFMVYAAGLLVYFASWIMQINFRHSGWSRSAAGLLAPAYTPLIWFIGIALIGQSWIYFAISVAFTAVHLRHNVNVFGLH